MMAHMPHTHFHTQRTAACAPCPAQRRTALQCNGCMGSSQCASPATNLLPVAAHRVCPPIRHLCPQDSGAEAEERARSEGVAAREGEGGAAGEGFTPVRCDRAAAAAAAAAVSLTCERRMGSRTLLVRGPIHWQTA